MPQTATPFETTAALLLHAQAQLGEGAIWDPLRQRLYWVDIEGMALHCFDPATGHDRAWPVGSRISTIVPVEGGDVLVALQSGIHRLHPETGTLTFLNNPLTDPAIRFNDGKCDPAGRFWVGTFPMDERMGAAVLYRMDRNGSMHLMLEDVSNSNGIVWSADRTAMYYIDTPSQCVQAFDYDDASGNISNRRIVVRIPEESGSPDGMAIDAEGMIWVALWGGGCVARYDPGTGALLQKVHVPAPNTSSCAFGGPDLKTLFITTARQGLGREALEAWPLSGDLFVAEPGVTGVAANFYKPQ